MEIEDVLESCVEDLPMSNSYRLLCEDAEPEANAELVKKTLKTAQKIKKVIEVGKLKHNFDYKNLDYWTLQDVKHPLEKCKNAVMKTTSSVAKFEWKKPESVEILMEHNICVMFVKIPSEIFGNRDFLNVTYAVKRAHYLCAIANLLGKLEFKDIYFLNTDNLYPDILIEGNIQISCSNADIAKTRRFIPTLGNLRPATIFENLKLEEDIATPHFNQRILATIVGPKIRIELQENLGKMKDAPFAYRLLKRFLNNRQLFKISGMVLNSRMLRLIKQGQITDKQEILTVLRILVKDMVTWSSEDIEYVEIEEGLDEEIEKGYKTHFEVNLIHDHWNVAHNLTLNDLYRMKKELITILPLLGDIYAFDGIFINSMPFFAQFDYYARLTVSISDLKPIMQLLGNDVVDNQDVISKFVRYFEKLITKTMNERYEYIGIKNLDEEKEDKWKTVEYAKNPSKQVFVIGFRANSQWTNPLTVGPSAQTEEAKEFRELWKGASELRKFADNRICECVVWSKEGNDRVPFLILNFLLQKILGMPPKCLAWRNFDHTNILPDQSNTELVAKAFAGLSGILRSLKGIPLMITNVHGISPYIRGVEPVMPSILAAATLPSEEKFVVPEDGKIPPYTPTVTVHIKLEYSGKWGNDVEAIRRLTSSFYVKISEKLREKDIIAVPTIDQIFVVQEGIVFKLIIVNDKILSILEEAVEKLKDSGASRIESSLEGMRLSAWKKRFVTEPQLQMSLQSFCTSHRMYSSTVQMVKRWLGAKLLCSHVDDLVIEMIVVAAISMKGMVEPKSSWCAFVRTLHLIANHNWLTRPLIVDLGKNWNEEERAKLEETFVKMRPVLPPMVIITDEDIIGSRFTREKPSGIILKRLIAFASEALKSLERNLVSEKLVDLEEVLLREEYTAYDAIIELENSAIVRKKGILERKAKARRLPVVEFDPVDELVYQLNNQFQQVAMFFYNKYGGDKIGVKFKPNEMEVPAKIARCILHKSVNDATLCLNKSEILENIRIIGRGIVSDVRILKD